MVICMYCHMINELFIELYHRLNKYLQKHQQVYLNGLITRHFISLRTADLVIVETVELDIADLIVSQIRYPLCT
jgi:hypothetical protein